MTEQERLDKIAGIIEQVENRSMAADGPVTPTSDEIHDDEILQIYRLAKGEKICSTCKGEGKIPCHGLCGHQKNKKSTPFTCHKCKGTGRG